MCVLRLSRHRACVWVLLLMWLCDVDVSVDVILLTGEEWMRLIYAGVF